LFVTVIGTAAAYTSS